MKEFKKFLPNQRLLKANFFGSAKNYEKKIYDICKKNSSFDVPSLASLQGIPEVSKSWMSSTSLSLGFLAFLIRICKPKNILEIGTFVGRATKTFLLNSKQDAHVVTIEKFTSAHTAAQKNLKKEIKNKKCTILLGDAQEVLLKNKKTQLKFDLVFIDGDKECYHQYLNFLSKKIRKNGLIIIDDVFFQGDTMNKKPKTIKGKGVKKCITLARNLKGFSKICLPFGNGILILYKN